VKRPSRFSTLKIRDSGRLKTNSGLYSPFPYLEICKWRKKKERGDVAYDASTCVWYEMSGKIPVPNLQAARALEAGTVTVTSMINVIAQTFARHISLPAHPMLPAFLKHLPRL
jgi:hypothetical protein